LSRVALVRRRTRDLSRVDGTVVDDALRVINGQDTTVDLELVEVSSDEHGSERRWPKALRRAT
jgi:hypothetical protein